MDQKPRKPVVCPNCFGTTRREILATATSRNIVHDDSPTNGGLGRERRRELVKMLCLHCGNELNPRGGRT